MVEIHDDSIRYSTLNLVHDMGIWLSRYRVRFFFATLFRILGDIVNLYPAFAIARIVTLLSAYEAGQSMNDIWMYAIYAGIAYLLGICGKQSGKLLGFHVSERIALDAQLQTIRHLFNLDLTWHEKENSGNKLKRMQKGGEGLDRILRIWISNFMEIGVNFVGISIILFTQNRMIAGVFVAFLCIYYVISLFFTKRASAASQQVNIGEEDMYGISFEAINNIRSVKVLGMAAPLIEYIQHVIDALFGKIKRRIFWFQWRVVAVDFFSYGFYICMMIAIVWGIAQGRYEVGFLVLFSQYFSKVRESIEELSMVTLDFVVAKYGVGRMMKMLQEPIGIDAELNKKDFPKDWKTIEIRIASFAYQKGKPVLRDVSFDIKRGERIGVIGLSGAGKSTLFKLLLKEHEQYKGDIRIGNVSLKDIRRSSLFQHAAVVLQDTEVFNFPLRDNITMANHAERDNRELLDRSMHIAHITDFLKKLPQGLDTFIGEKGVKLSGGEKQRVGIARAIFKQPDLLFLDEATSHLDMESEEKIKDSLHHFFQEVTAVVIAHRLSTVKEMDKIIVMENGTIMEEGTFDELYKKKGRFYELWEKQKF